jgi:hypothetical protein
MWIREEAAEQSVATLLSSNPNMPRAPPRRMPFSQRQTHRKRETTFISFLNFKMTNTGYFTKCVDMVRDSFMPSMDETNERLYDEHPDPEIGECDTASSSEDNFLSYFDLLQTLTAIRTLSRSHDGTLASANEAHDRIIRISTGVISDLIPQATAQVVAEANKVIEESKKTLHRLEA